MNYQSLLPFAVALLPFIKKPAGSRSILPIPSGSKVEGLIEEYSGGMNNLITDNSKAALIYEDFKSVMPENLFTALYYLNPQLVNRNMISAYSRLKIGEFGFSTILLSWYPESILGSISQLQFGKDTFQGIPIDFPIPDFPELEEININFTNEEDQALLSKRSFNYVKYPKNKIDKIYLYQINPKQLNAVIESIPDANLLPNLISMKITTISTAYLSFSSLEKLLSFYRVHKNAFKRVSISCGNYYDKIIVEENKADVFFYFIKKGFHPEILKEFLDGFIFTRYSELRKF